MPAAHPSAQGGYVDDVHDPGGVTKLGVTLATARAFKLGMDGDSDVDKADVKALTPAAVAPVYHRGYWLASSAEICPTGLDYIVFDCAMNQGVGRATKWLQTVAGVAADGVIGPVSIAAVQRVYAERAVKAFSALREAHFRSLPTFGRFGNHWMRRLSEATAWAVREAS
ncbi:glycoside hydrolase family 108 protein [Caulobacter sp. FWC2]|uniref:glycoside hydrolase family 108 protein n=1 Tax=Caulobacter sp. FWC2 TaxID=69664 RepID=UPI000C153F62|nr:glycosyl hydrolase 108 family protein [Caulobacter sp. FWC2]PIB92316.1 hypothetical protein CSW62_12515 [Caulobacter sp. FWC2]